MIKLTKNYGDNLLKFNNEILDYFVDSNDKLEPVKCIDIQECKRVGSNYLTLKKHDLKTDSVSYLFSPDEYVYIGLNVLYHNQLIYLYKKKRGGKWELNYV